MNERNGVTGFQDLAMARPSIHWEEGNYDSLQSTIVHCRLCCLEEEVWRVG